MLFIRRGWWNWDMVEKEWVLLNEVDTLPLQNGIEAAERLAELTTSYLDHGYQHHFDAATDTHHIWLSYTLKTTFELHKDVEYPRTLMQFADFLRWSYAEIESLKEVLGDGQPKDFVRWMNSAFRREMREINDFLWMCAR